MLALERVEEGDDVGMVRGHQNLPFRENPLHFVPLHHVVLLCHLHGVEFTCLLFANEVHLADGSFAELTDFLEVGEARGILRKKSLMENNGKQEGSSGPLPIHSKIMLQITFKITCVCVGNN